jgi:hypothetical protein
MNVTALSGRALTTVLSKIFRRSCAALHLLARWKLSCSGTSKNAACQRTKEVGSLLGARAREREMTCESSITRTNPPNACMHGRIRFTLRYKSVAKSRCVHVNLDIVGSERRMRRTWQTSTRPRRTCAASRSRAWSRVLGACKLTKVWRTRVELPHWKNKRREGKSHKVLQESAIHVLDRVEPKTLPTRGLRERCVSSRRPRLRWRVWSLEAGTTAECVGSEGADVPRVPQCPKRAGR